MITLLLRNDLTHEGQKRYDKGELIAIEQVHIKPEMQQKLFGHGTEHAAIIVVGLKEFKVLTCLPNVFKGEGRTKPMTLLAFNIGLIIGGIAGLHKDS